MATSSAFGSTMTAISKLLPSARALDVSHRQVDHQFSLPALSGSFVCRLLLLFVGRLHFKLAEPELLEHVRNSIDPERRGDHFICGRARSAAGPLRRPTVRFSRSRPVTYAYPSATV